MRKLGRRSEKLFLQYVLAFETVFGRKVEVKTEINQDFVFSVYLSLVDENRVVGIWK